LFEKVKFEYFEEQIKKHKVEDVDDKNFKDHVTFFFNNRALVKAHKIHNKIDKNASGA